MKRVFNLIIVDESGSMCVIEKQALMGLNETIETVKKMQGLHKDMEQRVTLITFDSSHKRYVFDNVPARATHKLTNKDYRPGGATPLYDAIGMGISKLNAQTKLKKQNWTFTLIGTDNLDVEGMASAMAIDNHLEFKEDEVGTEKMFAFERRSRARYNECMACSAPIPKGSYFDEDEKKNKG